MHPQKLPKGFGYRNQYIFGQNLLGAAGEFKQALGSWHPLILRPELIPQELSIT